MDIKLAVISRLAQPIRKVSSAVNYRRKNYEDVIWLIGDGRSGTTWVSNTINYDKRYRPMFEPFHPRVINSLTPHRYIRPEISNKQMEAFASEVFSGKLTHRRVDRDNFSLIYKGILVKDIFANLFSRWVFVRFSNIKIKKKRGVLG